MKLKAMINNLLKAPAVAYIVSLVCLMAIAYGVASEIVIDPAWDFTGKIFLLINFGSGVVLSLLILLRR